MLLLLLLLLPPPPPPRLLLLLRLLLLQLLLLLLPALLLLALEERGDGVHAVQHVAHEHAVLLPARALLLAPSRGPQHQVLLRGVPDGAPGGRQPRQPLLEPQLGAPQLLLAQPVVLGLQPLPAHHTTHASQK